VTTTAPDSTTTETEVLRYEPEVLQYTETDPISVGTVEPFSCQPWCSYEPGHDREKLDNDKDQQCRGAQRHLPLHLHEKVSYGKNDWRRDYIVVHPQKNFGREPVIFMGRGEDAGTEMMLEEALLLAHELVLAVEQVRAATA